MTAGSTGSAHNDAPGTTLSGRPGLAVVGQALAMMFDGPIGQDAAQNGLVIQDAIDTLVVDALDACLANAPDTMASLIAQIADRHQREGVSRAMNVLAAVVTHGRGGPGQPGEDVELTAPVNGTHTAEQRMVAVRSARLASDFLTATRDHDGVRLVTTLKDLRPENFQPVLRILVTHAAGLLDASVDVRTQVDHALDAQPCPTQA
jgi:hypothetical protein